MTDTQCKGCSDFCPDMELGAASKAQWLKSRAKYYAVPKGSYLFRENDPCEAIYILHKGRVKLCTVDSDGQEHITGLFAEHETIWEGILVPSSRHSADAVCLTDVEYCRLERKDLEKALTDSALAMRIIGLLSKKLHDANRRNKVKSMIDPKARVAAFLTYILRRQSGDTITLRLDELAGSLALRPETVSRKIKELEREGYIRKIGQSTIKVLNPDKLFEIGNY